MISTSSLGYSLFRSFRSAIARRLRSRSLRRTPRGLSLLAGRSAGFEALEHLEERKLLFTLTIGAGSVDPMTGIGSVVIPDTAYHIPFARNEPIEPVEDEVVVEEFQDEAQSQWGMGNPAVPPNGIDFLQSGIRISYRTQSQSPVVLIPGADFTQNGANDLDLRIALATTDEMTFSFLSGDGSGGAQTPRLTRRAVITVSNGTDGDGLNANALSGTRIELLLNGQVVDTISGVEITQNSTPVIGPNNPFSVTLAFNEGFDAFRFRSAAETPNNSTYADSFVLDDINVSFPGGTYAGEVVSRLFAFRGVFSGPVGATITFLDLYGRPMIPTMVAGLPEGSEVPVIDANDDGLVGWNDGIGRILISGGDANTNLTLQGGGVMDDPDDMGGNLLFDLPDSVAGLTDEFEQAGFGYALTNDPMDPQVIGLGGGGGALIIGSPIVRNRVSSNAYYGNVNLPPAADLFVRTDQGIFVNGSVGSINLNAILHGSSSVTGSIGRFATGTMLGSLRVEGDMGQFIVAADAGLWQRDDDSDVDANTRPFNTTNSQLVVGRTVGEVLIGGRSNMDITVLGDINNPARAVRSFLDYAEREVVLAINPGVTDPIPTTLQTNLNRNAAAGTQAIPFGLGYFRNDFIQDAEFVGYNGTTVRITGGLGAIDPVNAAEDTSDVFAFAVDASNDVVIQGSASLNGYFRVVDRNGRVVAALDSGESGRGLYGNITSSNILRFRPEQADVYYLVVSERPNGGFTVGGSYQITIAGMAPTTFGAFRTGLGAGGGNDPFVLSLNAGNMGSLRLATGVYDSSGSLLNGSALVNTNQDTESLYEFNASTVSVSGNLYNALLGGNVDGGQLLVGRNLGTLVTGDALVFGNSILIGDLISFDLRVGGTIAMLDIQGAAAADQDPTRADGGGTATIRTGTLGGPGHIGQFLIGAYTTSGLSVQTSPGSIVDTILVGNANDGAGSEYPAQVRGNAPTIRLGAGSDLRFADFGLIQTNGSPNAFTNIGIGQSFTFVDDSGAVVTISVTGGPNGGGAGSSVQVRTLAVNGSQGVAIARIDGNLIAGANLNINSITPGTVSIGQIRVSSDFTGSQIIMSGVGEVDVHRIVVTGGRVQTIANNTVNGDIVAVDASALSNINVFGDLGRTQTSGVVSPVSLGKFMGLAPGRTGTVLGPIGVTEQALNQGDGGDWDGQGIFFPVNPVNADDWDTPTALETVGSPVDAYLNGVIVRGGDLLSVNARGSVGDVIVEGGDVLNIIANSDNITPTGQFHGIVGTVYANSVNTVDVGDGLEGTGPSPFAAAGIFADDDIVQVSATRLAGNVIRGVVAAANLNQGNTTVGIENPIEIGVLEGVRVVQVFNGRFDSAFIHAGNLDDFWQSSTFRDVGVVAGIVTLVNGVNSDLFRSQISATLVNQVTITGGAYDATRINSTGSINLVRADEFRNTTALGEGTEFVLNAISATNNIGSILVNNINVGNISDLAVDAGGTITGQVSARNIERSSFAVDNQINSINATNDFRGNSIVTGEVVNLAVLGDIRSSSISVAGPVRSITATGEITLLDLLSSGPFGRIDLVRAGGQITGNFISTGPIGTIQSLNSDIIATISTTDPEDGDLDLLKAGRDLRVDLQVFRNARNLEAGRHVGALNDSRARAIDIRGNLANVLAPNGQIYTDILVGQSITGMITNGRVDMRPGFDQTASADIIAFGRINSLMLRGDFNGDIISFSGGISSLIITDGSFRPGNRIAAYGGDLDLIRIKGGDLLGDIYTEGDLKVLELVNGDDGWKGNIGVTSFKRNNRQFKDDIRNDLPPNVSRTTGVDGVTIQALGSIGRIFLQQGSIWESQIIAGEDINLIDVFLQIRNDGLTTGRTNVIAAGNRIETIRTGQFTSGLFVLAGVKSFGDDGMPQGTGNNADTIVAGSIGTIDFRRFGTNITIAAGVNPGANGRYLDSDDTFATGFSSIGSIFIGLGNAAVRAYAAGSIGPVTAGIVTDVSQPQSQPTKVVGITGVAATSGVPFAFTTTSGQVGSFTYTGTGQALWNAARNRITLVGSVSSLTVGANLNILTNFEILGADNASLDNLIVNAELRGASNIFADLALTSATFNRRVDTTGFIGTGGNINSLVFNGGFIDGDIEARNLGTLNVTGDFGRTGTTGDAIVLVRDLTSLTVTGGTFAGTVSSERDIDNVTLGAVNEGGIRAAREITNFTSGSFTRSRLTAGERLGNVTVNGDAFDSAFYAGADLGEDANFGGSGFNADKAFNGSIGSLTVNGNFRESDISAGVLRGPDGFLGTADDIAADGRSSIGNVIITGAQTGSNFNSEQYRIITTGTIGTVTVNSLPFTVRNNFRVTRLQGNPVPIQVTSARTVEDGRVYTHELIFNQAIDQSSISNSLSIAQVRSGGVLVGLALNTDYTFKYNADTFTLSITFSRNVTDRSLPELPGVPGPGLYRIVLDAQGLRGQTQLARLDGDANGVAGDDFSYDDFVGDAGDKINAGNPNTVAGVDFYGAAPLDLFLDSNADSDDLPDTNRFITLRGVLGDHPDANSNSFRIGGDVDVYRISLRAGQILRLGAVEGIALSLQRGIYDANGQLLAFSGGGQGRQVVNANGPVRQLPAADASNVGDVLGNDEYLILQTGTYFIAVSGAIQAANIADINAVLNVTPTPGAVGSYAFGVQVFDDGDTGFAGDSNSGDGQLLPQTPVPQDFAGTDGIAGTADDLTTYVIGDFTFTWDRKNIANTFDDVIRGSNSEGNITINRFNGRDGVFGNVDDRIEYTTRSAIGNTGSTGVPNEVQPDIDVYRLNGGNPIAPGTRFNAVLRLTETGSNIGLAGANSAALLNSSLSAADRLSLLTNAAALPGNVQFALFEIPSGAGLEGGRLVGSPSDFLPIGGQDAVTKTNGTFSYGYNAAGDFFIDFIVPGAQGIDAAVPAEYALYIQGAVRSDYELFVTQNGRRDFAPDRQLILLETNGGMIDWLEAGDGVTTTLDPFRAAAAGFAGQINGQDVDDYILQNLIFRLNDIFAAANANIAFSYSPVDYEGLPFSTVFLAGNSEPNAFFNNGTFGAVEHVDAFNADKTDQGIVYITSLTTQGNDPSAAGVDRFLDQLTAAVARRVGELVGLSFETSNTSAASPVPILGSNSIDTPPAGAGVYSFSNTNRNLGGRTDGTNTQIFFLGQQNSLGLLNRFVAKQITS